MANSGLFLRASRDGSNPAFSGCEIQILDDFNWEKESGTTLLPYQRTGGLYGSVANPKPDALRPLGEWNTYDITVRGNRLTVVLNGQTVINAAELPDLPATGPVGLQHHGGKKGGVWTSPPSLVQFRNIFIKELSKP
jgi:hypothetical protein